MRILDIVLKDLRQLVRDRMLFLFLLVMPIVFTVLFGFAFGGFSSGSADPRLPVGFLDLDGGRLGGELRAMLAESAVVRLDEKAGRTAADLEQAVGEEELAAAVVVPAGYSAGVTAGAGPQPQLIADTATAAGSAAQGEVLVAAARVADAARVAEVVSRVLDSGEAGREAALARALSGWRSPPVVVTLTDAAAPAAVEGNGPPTLAHTSAGMMVQFALAGLLTAAQVMVNEKRSGSLRRLLTTATRRVHILLGHFLAILVMILGQFVLLVVFGQLVLGVNYLASPAGAALMMAATALMVAALGVLIGMAARNHEQALTLSLILMFVLSGVGGAWLPLEVTSSTFQSVGHLSPVAWAMDGFKNVTSRNLGFSSTLTPAAVLLGYAAAFFALAAWRMWANVRD